jgi:peptidoglycan-N-acetylglucosamine deacetylase
MMAKKHLIGIVFIAILTVLVVSNPLSSQYISLLKEESVTVSGGEKSSLLLQIQEQAENFEVPAEDAKIDPVWKARPGYNGLKVNIDASYKKMKKSMKFDQEKLVFEEVSPKIHLNDLPPAPIYKGHSDKSMVGLLINVAWGNEYIPDMLSTLKENKVYATFFLEGRWVKENPDLAKMIAEAGHEIGNHSYTHPDMRTISSTKAKVELEKTTKVIEGTTGKSVKWFAPPSGSIRDEVVKIADDMNLGTIMWSIDTIDWQKPRPSVIVQRVTSKLHNGALILMHPTQSTASALPILIHEIKEKNLRLGTVTNVLKEERIEQGGNKSLQQGEINIKQ